MKKAPLFGLFGVIIGVFVAYAAGEVTTKEIGSVADIGNCSAKVVLFTSDHGTKTILSTSDKYGVNRVSILLDTKNLNELIDYLKQASWKMPSQ